MPVSVESETYDLAGGVHQDVEAAVGIEMEFPSVVPFSRGHVAAPFLTALFPRHLPGVHKNRAEKASVRGKIQLDLAMATSGIGVR